MKEAVGVENRVIAIVADAEDILDYKITSSSGMFHLEGNTAGRSPNESYIDPVLKIYHKCDEDADKVITRYIFRLLENAYIRMHFCGIFTIRPD